MRKNLEIDNDIVEWFKVNYPGVTFSPVVNYILRYFISLHPTHIQYKSLLEKAVAQFKIEMKDDGD